MQHYKKDETPPPTSRALAFVQRLITNRSLAHTNQKVNQQQENQNQYQNNESTTNGGAELQQEIHLGKDDTTAEQRGSSLASVDASRKHKNSVGNENGGYRSSEIDIDRNHIDTNTIEKQWQDA